MSPADQVAGPYAGSTATGGGLLSAAAAAAAFFFLALFQDGCVLSRDDNDTNGAEIDAMQQILRRQICR